jgi:Fic family protein
MKKIEPPPASQNMREWYNNLDEGERQFILLWANMTTVLNEIDTDYLYWDKVKYKSVADMGDLLTNRDLWMLVKNKRRKEYKKIYVAGETFFYLQNDPLNERLHQFDLNLGGSLGGQQPIPDVDKHRYLLGSIMEESIASSQIEGAVTSRVVAKEMLRKERPPRTVSERMIVNNYQAIQYIDAHKHERLTAKNLLTIHRLMTDQTLDNPEEAGQLRQKDDVHVVDAIDGEIIHTPPASASIPLFVDELCRFFNDESPDYFLHPVVKASIIHFLIGYFHPFTDGNGRTARALFYWYMLRKGYWLTEYLSISRVIKESRGQYYRAFQYAELDENDLTYFVLYQVKTLSKAYDELTKYLARKQEEKQVILALQRSEKLSPRQAQIVDWLRHEPNASLSAKEVENRLGVSNQTARTDIQALIKAGYLDELVINRKERNYVRGPKLVTGS